ncbi:MAG: tetratricopeptide repeat protein [Deltaproteobacteria bacterium]|nr:MAG: tetratricopeptide repeat protein [Deltaproteobacteria bacterium]
MAVSRNRLLPAVRHLDGVSCYSQFVRWIGVALGCALWLAAPAALADAADAHYRLAKTLRNEGRYEEALAEIDLAVAARPTYAQGHITRGSILRRLGRYEEALKAFKRAIQLEPNDGRAHGLAGAVLLRLDRPRP